MESYTFHRDDLVPEDIDTQEKLNDFLQLDEKPIFKERQRVRNINNLKHVMIISKKVRKNSKLEGFECYWWE